MITWLITRFIAVTSALAVMVAAAPAHASNAGFGYISGIYAMANGAVLFDVASYRGTPPPCQGAALGTRFALDASTVAGQAQVALLLNAYNMHRRIAVAGQGTCSIWGDTETVLYFVMQD